MQIMPTLLVAHLVAGASGRRSGRGRCGHLYWSLAMACVFIKKGSICRLCCWDALYLNMTLLTCFSRQWMDHCCHSASYYYPVKLIILLHFVNGNAFCHIYWTCFLKFSVSSFIGARRTTCVVVYKRASIFPLRTGPSSQVQRLRQVQTLTQFLL